MKCKRCGGSLYSVSLIAAAGQFRDTNPSLEFIPFVNDCFDPYTTALLAPPSAPSKPLPVSWRGVKPHKVRGQEEAQYKQKKAIWDQTKQMHERAVFCPCCKLVFCDGYEVRLEDYVDFLKKHAEQVMSQQIASV